MGPGKTARRRAGTRSRGRSAQEARQVQGRSHPRLDPAASEAPREAHRRANVTSAAGIPRESPAPPGHHPARGARPRGQEKGNNVPGAAPRAAGAQGRAEAGGVRLAPRGQERTHSRRGGDTLGTRRGPLGAGPGPQLWALRSRGAGPAAPRCGGGGAELGRRWRSGGRRGEPRGVAPGFPGSDCARRGTGARKAGRPRSGRLLVRFPLVLSLTSRAGDGLAQAREGCPGRGHVGSKPGLGAPPGQGHGFGLLW